MAEPDFEKFKKPYDATETEPRLYDRWEESGYFNPDNLPEGLTAGNGKPYTIVMPPPNANGSLHAGHALFITIEDIFTRFKRMRGYKALWLPGADHAGFETQVVYERQLEKEGRSRFNMDPRDLYDEILAFTLANKSNMEQQVRALGASCDWSREKFTLDPDVIETVQDTFIKMYQDELIYRGKRIVNWCSKHQTSLSDVETESVEEKSKLYYFQYGPFEIATARPETKFGDKYVVMHPDDERYAKWKHGDTMTVEWINGPLQATVIKDTAIDPAFGTGVMTITPWHSGVDFEIANRHGLDIEQIIDWRGRLLPIAGEFAGMKIAEAREKIVEKLANKGLLTRVDENYTHVVKRCYKCNTLIEPQVKDQWFVKMAPLARLALDAADRGELRFIPEHEEKIFRYWMENALDWNISRQIVWGIPIPAHFCATCETPKIGATVESKWFIVRHGETEMNVNRQVQGQNDSPLTETGRAQIEKLGAELAKHKIDLIISSDLGRTKETSEILAKATGADIIYEPALRERSYGPHEGKSYEEVDGLHRDLSGYHQSIEGIESYIEVEDRAWNAFEEYRKTHRAKNVVVVTHGGTIRTLKRRLYDLSPEEALHPGTSARNGEALTLDHLDSNCANCGSELFIPDSDTFDTWFSSGQWPLITTGFSNDGKHSKDFDTFYPTDVMETGRDLVFKWVPRMVIFGLYLAQKSPFHTIYLHGLVNDAQGKKMSKSKGNVVNPLDLTQKYGTDALRMALVVGNTPGTDLALDENRVKGYKHFANKLWNIARFVLENTQHVDDSIELLEDDQILKDELDALARDVTSDLDDYRVHLAAEKLYHYAWDRFAAEIIEESKPILAADESGATAKRSRQLLLRILLVDLLKLLHPFTPFVTEEIWQSLPDNDAEQENFLMVARWPAA
ncbi:MAG: class I tRNA ligase family protein [Candidatus Pacebacteria bacterium]|nr:class I tRNA ligase family protein [Candidatus Paceibacterota bacterium]